MNNSEIVAKWRAEAHLQEFDYVLQELQWHASQVGSDGTRLSPVEGVYESDELIPEDLLQALKAGASTIQQRDAPDWHPGSNQQVLDLVHPSLFCYVKGVTRIAPQAPFSSWIGAGEPEPADLSPEKPPAGLRTFARWSSQTSKKFQWLPSDVSVTAEGRVSIASYINNLHPKQYPGLYCALEGILERFIPLWNRVLTDAAFPAGERVAVDMHDLYEGESPDFENSDGEWDHDACREFFENRHVDNKPALVERGFEAPERVAPHSAVELRGRELQVIVKLGSIELTPEKPDYPGGVWHVEGMANEVYIVHCVLCTCCYNTQ